MTFGIGKFNKEDRQTLRAYKEHIQETESKEDDKAFKKLSRKEKMEAASLWAKEEAKKTEEANTQGTTVEKTQTPETKPEATTTTETAPKAEETPAVEEKKSADIDVDYKTPLKEMPKETTYTVQSGETITEVVKKSLKAQGIENPTPEQLEEAVAKFKQVNAEHIHKTSTGYEYLYAGAEVKLSGEVDTTGNKTAKEIHKNSADKQLEKAKERMKDAPTTEHKVEPGDSYWGIAKENLIASGNEKPTNAQIAEEMYNIEALNDKAKLKPGQEIKVPNHSGLVEVPEVQIDEVAEEEINPEELEPVEVEDEPVDIEPVIPAVTNNPPTTVNDSTPPVNVNDSTPPVNVNDSTPPVNVNDSTPPVSVNDSTPEVVTVPEVQIDEVAEEEINPEELEPVEVEDEPVDIEITTTMNINGEEVTGVLKENEDGTKTLVVSAENGNTEYHLDTNEKITETTTYNNDGSIKETNLTYQDGDVTSIKDFEEGKKVDMVIDGERITGKVKTNDEGEKVLVVEQDDTTTVYSFEYDEEGKVTDYEATQL